MKCPKCNKGNVRQQVNVFVDCPADCHSLNKKGIRNRDVIIQGVGWDMATWYCDKSCGFFKRLKAAKT